MNVYAFDVDETLEVSAGPIPIASMLELRDQGHIVGLCGNLAQFCRTVPDWHRYVSFLLNYDSGYPGPTNIGGLLPKDWWLRIFRDVTYSGADDYVMVGNILGVTGASDDNGSAERAGWRFISERDFAAGAR
jgi:hypothetical protein